MRFYVLFFIAFVNSVVAEECSENEWLVQKEPDTEIRLNIGPINKLEVSSFWFTSYECIRMPTEEFYVIQYNKNGYPSIIDKETGHSPELKSVDLDADGIEEVLLTFKSGGNQTSMNIYKLADFSISKVNTLELASNMDAVDVVVNDNRPVYIRVSNAQFDSSNKQSIVVESYYLSNGKLVPVKK